MIDLNAVIEPGKSAAGLSIGDPVVKLSQPDRPTRQTLGDGFELLDFGPVLVWAKGGVVFQIGVGEGYAGYISGTAIGVGSTIQQIINAIGQVAEDEEDNLILANLPGICFETEAWRGDPRRQTVEENLDAKLTAIFVFAE